VTANANFNDDMRLFPLRDSLLAGGFACLLVAACASAVPGRQLLQNPVITHVGFISYSLYLLHQNVVYYFGELLKRVGHLGSSSRFLILITLGLLIVLAVCYPFFKVFEEPFLRPRQKKRASDHAPAPQLAPAQAPTGALANSPTPQPV